MPNHNEHGYFEDLIRTKFEMVKWFENRIKSMNFEGWVDKTIEVGCIDKNVDIVFSREV